MSTMMPAGAMLAPAPRAGAAGGMMKRAGGILGQRLGQAAGQGGGGGVMGMVRRVASARRPGVAPGATPGPTPRPTTPTNLPTLEPGEGATPAAPNPVPLPTTLPTVQPATPAAPTTGAGGAQLQAIRPGQDLRGTAILPGASARTTAAAGAMDGALGRYQGAADGLAQLPDRTALANQKFEQLAGSMMKRAGGIFGQRLGQAAGQGGGGGVMTPTNLPTLEPGEGATPAAPNPVPLPTTLPTVQPATPAAPTTGAGGAQLQAIRPGQDLRGTAILPGASARTTAAAGAMDGALGRYQGAADGLAQLPDRTALANQKFEQLAGSIGRQASRLGRLGSGMVTNQLGQAGAQLAIEAAEGETSDRMARLSAQRAVFGDLSDGYGRERAYDAADRGELRGERDYQNVLEGQAWSRRRDQTLLEDQLESSRLGRAGQLWSMGNANDPTAAYFQRGASLGAQGADAMGAAGDLLAEWAYRRRMQPGTVATAR